MNIPIKYKTSLASVHREGAEAINYSFYKAVPGANCCLISLDDNDFTAGNITYNLYEDEPELLKVTVPFGQSIFDAVTMVIELNQHVKMKTCGQPFTIRTVKQNLFVVHMLRVLSNTTGVNDCGMLISES